MTPADTMLANRLRNRQRHLRKWARRTGVTCYRLFERDMTDHPLVIDWYDGEAVVWAYPRTRDETPEDEAAFLQSVLRQTAEALDLAPDSVILKQRRRQNPREGDQYKKVADTGHARLVSEYGLTFEVNLRDYLDTGLFLDHRTTRDMVRERSLGKRVLNLFAYTGSFTCAARAGGAAQSDTVDMSRTYCQWARRNFEHNGFPADPAHEVMQADCLAWLNDAEDAGRVYDIVICDPPTFSNSARMEADSFVIERDHAALIAQCCRLLSADGVLIFSTNARRFKLDDDAVPSGFTAREMTERTVPEDFRNRTIHQCWFVRRAVQ